MRENNENWYIMLSIRIKQIKLMKDNANEAEN